MARGEYMELATNREDVICGDTMAYTDRFLTSVAAEMSVALPERVFVRYEWVDAMIDEEGHPTSSGAVSYNGDQLVVRSNRLLYEHELVHAVHLQAWPRSRSLFHEGLAVLLDSRTDYEQGEWPVGEPIDPLLEDGSLDRPEYAKAWFLVSQIVRDHGMDGLRELWHAVPPDARASQVRQAYQDLFGRPIDALLEPIEEFPGFPEPRLSCHLNLCEEPEPWDGEVWRAEGPFGCVDDPDALGPMGNIGTGPVERYHVVDLEPSASFRFTTTGGAGVYLRPCGLQCTPRSTPADAFSPDTSITRDYPGGRYRVELLAEFEDLPTETPGTFEIERLGP